MTRDQWRQLHRSARERRRVEIPGCYLTRDHVSYLGITKRHDSGHLIAPAAIVHVLQHAAASRHIRSDHAIYIDRVRQLRRRSTWL